MSKHNRKVRRVSVLAWPDIKVTTHPQWVKGGAELSVKSGDEPSDKRVKAFLYDHEIENLINALRAAQQENHR